MHSKEERREAAKVGPVGHAANRVTKPKIVGMVTPRAEHPENKTRAKEKERMANKPWARATAKTIVAKQEAKEEAKRGGARMDFKANATHVASLDTAPNGAPKQGKEEEEAR